MVRKAFELQTQVSKLIIFSLLFVVEMQIYEFSLVDEVGASIHLVRLLLCHTFYNILDWNL